MSTLRSSSDAQALFDVPRDVYRTLRAARRNYRLRMTYHDGTLIFMSPEYIHDRHAEQISMIVREVVAAFGIAAAGTRTTTFWRAGREPLKGSGKEPDAGFYIGPNEARIRGKPTIDLNVDPPPDLAIEIDHKSDSAIALLTYAGLLVPEVWRYTVKTNTLWFGCLNPNGDYETVLRSRILPMLTPELVVAALAHGRDLDETTWGLWLRGWARELAETRDGE